MDEESRTELQELAAFADAEHFLELCRELRDSMVFYDRDVLVAMATSILEGMVVAHLFLAALDGDDTFHAADTRLRHFFRTLPLRLRRGGLPMDAQAVVGRFLELGLPSAQAAYESVAQTFALWLKGQRPPKNLDRELYRARLAMDQGDDERALVYLGRAGVAVLHGQRIRPVWLRVGGRAAPYLNGLFAIREALLTHPLASYPLLPLREERRRYQSRGKVVHLEEVRRLRGETAVPDAYDEVDVMWEGILADGPVVRREDYERLGSLGREVLYPLLAIVRARELRRSKAAFVALHQLVGSRTRETIEAVLQLLREVTADDPLFAEALRVLEAAGQTAKEAVLDFAEEEADVRKRVALARVVSRYRGDERALGWLIRTFEAVGVHEGKAEVARSLARLGDARALPSLRAALSGEKWADRALESAIRTIAQS